jgi:hypothetical protein
MFDISAEDLNAEDEPYSGVNAMNYSILKGLNEMTGEEVIEKGKTIARKKLDTLNKKKVKAEKHKKKLKNFRIHSANLKTREGFMGDENIIHLKVENSTPQAISRVYFNGIYQSPDRSVPWFDGEFNYEISGGLESGEQAKWNLNPGLLSEWSDVTVRKEARLQVEVIRLDGPKGKMLYSGKIFDIEDKKLMNKLLQIYPGLKKEN